MAAKPQAEVIQEWADFDSAGYSFERGRMEKTVQALCFGDNAATVPAHVAAGPSQGQKLKKDDVDFIIAELLVSRQTAEATLAKYNGDMEKALTELVSGQ
ncbi:Dihydroneopterin aldolase domain protein [Pseudozyma hubeiensis]|nr:Dihydroneopterin aldolase domain protein [Pseudozyma hubeiensis]